MPNQDSSDGPIYLDYNATTPIAPEVGEAMKPYLFKHFGNPSSSHYYGSEAKMAVESARRKAAELLGCKTEEVVFTSGGTESNNYAIKGVAFKHRNKGKHIITSAIEHPAVLEVCNWLERQGFRISVLPVDEQGLVDPEDLKKTITADTILVSIMHANNEIGTIQPIPELTQIAHEHGALMHTDAAQSIGKIPVRVDELGIDLLSLAGHKLYAPKGIGALYIRTGTELEKILHGADHEMDRRPGTENVLEIVGLGKACEIAKRDLQENMKHFKKMRDMLHDGLLNELGEDSFRLNGHPEFRLPNTLNISFRGIDANTLLSEIQDEVAASAGAACHAEDVEISSVLEAMGVPVEWAMGTVRFSVGRGTSPQKMQKAIDVVSSTVKRLQPAAGEVCMPETEQKETYNLTQYTHGMGCACKLRPQALEEVLRTLPIPTDPNIIVGIETSDDAAVYRINDDMAIVQTVDFFTPIVDEPYWFGAISAANSLSDIYAMGARPILGVNIAGFPSNRLPLSVLEEILKGAQDKASEAGISVIGGHTVEDTEPKYGLAVTGLIHPDEVVRNSTAKPGDVLVLTKPIGLGIISTAVKRGLADESTRKTAREVMASLNREAAEVMMEVGVNACTDITGFGLLGHLREMAAGSKVDVSISARAVPSIEAARQLAGADVIPGGTRNNLSHVKPHLNVDDGVSQIDLYLLADAQTSGGLLISLPEDRVADLMSQLDERGVDQATIIGSVIDSGSGKIRITAE